MPDRQEADRRLARFLDAHLGSWSPGPGRVQVVESPRRDSPTWDGSTAPVQGVMTPSGGVLSVPPGRGRDVAQVIGSAGPGELGGLGPAIAEAAGHPGGRLLAGGIFRWAAEPEPFADAGEWFDADDPVVPEWLRPFGGEVLLHLDGGRYIAGVGIKRHDPLGAEIAVGTEPEARGRGLARHLVSQAARRIASTGAVVTYIHAPENSASSRVAEACGFPDLGWRAAALFPA
jgi:GNAT superfamily N-acetyltransferase